MLTHKNVVFLHYIAWVAVIEDYSLERKIMCFHIFNGQHHTVDGSKTCISDQNALKMKFFYYIFQLDPGFVKADGA